ncbi:MAG TPA: AI-2E family transporter YdiK [Anaeromyxobacteraceae bacterium]|nr:AI-2E family transporter YdiK [Anaeromyxobacteraceae bacterium]
MTIPTRQDLARITMAVLVLAILIAGTAWVLRPFLLALLWAAMIAVSTWPILLSVQRRLGGRRGPAVALMVALLLVLVVGPLYLAISTIVENAGRLVEVARSASTLGLPDPPEWLGRLPLVGPRLDAGWRSLAERGPDSIWAQLAPYGRDVARWLVSHAGSFGGTVVQLLLTVLITGILYSGGEAASVGVRRFFRRLAGQRGEDAVELAGKAVRAVALGVVVTAVAQSALTGLGLAVAGVPHAGLLGAITLVLCIAQIGPLLVLAPSVIWLYATGSTTWGTVLLVWSLGVLVLDNVMRPILIKKGANLPLLLIFAGVIGGLIGFGVVGLFIGPAILAVAYMLVGSWVAEIDREPAAGAP